MLAEIISDFENNVSKSFEEMKTLIESKGAIKLWRIDKGSEPKILVSLPLPTKHYPENKFELSEIGWSLVTEDTTKYANTVTHALFIVCNRESIRKEGTRHRPAVPIDIYAVKRDEPEVDSCVTPYDNSFLDKLKNCNPPESSAIDKIVEDCGVQLLSDIDSRHNGNSDRWIENSHTYDKDLPVGYIVITPRKQAATTMNLVGSRLVYSISNDININGLYLIR